MKTNNLTPRCGMNALNRFADALLTLLSASLVGIMLVAVFFRYVLGHALYWSDEVVRYLFVWFTLLGAALCVRQREHIRVEYFAEKLPVRIRRCVEWTMLFSVCLFHLAMVVLGFAWVWSMRGALTSALQWPLNWFFYAALPVSALLGLAYALQRLLRGEYTEVGSAPDEAAGSAEGGATWKS